jgi:F420-dependent methylenetetrahydromethanopterin dehydrogenase
MVFRPALQIVMVNLIKALPAHIIQKAIKDYGSEEDEIELPELFLNSRKQVFGHASSHAETKAVTLMCVNHKVRLMKELICLIPKDDMPYVFVHHGLATTHNK